MGKAATGHLRRLADGYEAQIRIASGPTGRKGYQLPHYGLEDREGADARCRALAEMASRLRAAKQGDLVDSIMERGAAARAGKAWDEVCATVETLCAGKTERTATGAMPTVAEFAESWAKGDLARKWPDHVEDKRTSDADEAYFRKYINPIIGPRRLDTVTLQHCDDVMASLPKHLKPSSRRRLGAALSRLMSIATYPARLMPTNPIPRGWLPRPGPRKAFSFLYPAEDSKLMAHEPIDLQYRMLYGTLAREGMRCAEAANLRWSDIDEVGFLKLDENKTDDPRKWFLDPGVARALKAWRTMRKDEPADAFVFTHPDGARILSSDDHMARLFRIHLQAAGIDRADLYAKSENRQPIRVHDLRATFVTLSLACGKTETYVMDRTGHKSSTMVHAYRRAARSAKEARLGWLAPLDESVPEIARMAQALPQDRQEGETSGGTGSKKRGNSKRPENQASRESTTTARHEPSSTDETANVGHSCAIDPLETALAAAAAAGQWDAVKLIAEELRARRLDGSGVVDLARRKVTR